MEGFTEGVDRTRTNVTEHNSQGAKRERDHTWLGSMLVTHRAETLPRTQLERTNADELTQPCGLLLELLHEKVEDALHAGVVSVLGEHRVVTFGGARQRNLNKRRAK